MSGAMTRSLRRMALSERSRKEPTALAFDFRQRRHGPPQFPTLVLERDNRDRNSVRLRFDEVNEFLEHTGDRRPAGDQSPGSPPGLRRACPPFSAALRHARRR